METIGKRYDNAMCSIYEVQKRFGRWDALLEEPQPPAYLNRTTATWRACRAIAYAAKQDFDNAALEQAAFRELLAARPQRQLPQAQRPVHRRGDRTSARRLGRGRGAVGRGRHHRRTRWAMANRRAGSSRCAIPWARCILRPSDMRMPSASIARTSPSGPETAGHSTGSRVPWNSKARTTKPRPPAPPFDHAWKNADNPLGTSCECIPEL